MRGMKEKDELYAEIADDGAVQVERHYVGRLKGFRFFPDTEAEGIHGKATPQRRRPRARQGAGHARAPRHLGQERCLQADAARQVLWREEEIARLEAGRGSAQAGGRSSWPTSI